MIRAVLETPENFVLVESDIPGIKDDEMLVKVIYSGICGSDIHSFLGRNLFITYPVILGHEFVGEIVELGKEVDTFRKGEIITSEPSIVCDKCEYCKRGDYHLCANIAFMEGSFSEYVIVKERNSYHVPETIDLQTAVLIEPLAVAVHSMNIARIKQGARVLVFGAGTIGQLVMQAAKYYGAAQIAILDLVKSKLETARKKGADHVLQLSSDKQHPEVFNAFHRESFDVIFDCVSNSYSVNTSIDLVKRGGAIVMVGQPTQDLTLSMEKVQIKELKVYGTFMYRNNFSESIKLIRDNKVNPSGFISRVYQFKDIQNAFNEVHKHGDRYIKCLLEF